MKPARQHLLFAGFIVALALLTIVAWVGWRQFERVEVATELVTHTQQVLTRLSRVLSLVQDIEAGGRGFVVTGEPAFLEPYEAARAQVEGEVRNLCGVVDDNPRQRAHCRELGPLVQKRLEASQTTVDLRRTQGFEAAQTAVISGGGKVLMDEVRQLIGRMESEEQVLLDRRTAEARFTARTTSIRTILAIGVSLVLLIATFAMVARENELRRNSEVALRASESRYRQLFSSIDEGFCIIEVIFDSRGKPIDYRFLEINPSFEKQTGISGAEGKRMREIAPDLEEYWFETFGRIVTTGEPARFVNHASALHRWFDVYAFRFGEPEQRQVAIIFNDITARKATEAEISKLNADLQIQAGGLEAANKELESFSYSVSHDLRAPLRSIDGFSQVLLEDCADQLSEDGKDALKRVRRAANTMGELIDALLTLSRVSRSQLRVEPVDLSAIATAVAAELRDSHPDRQVEFVIAPGITVEADSRLFRAMLTNLLENAWKYSGQRAVARIEFGQIEGGSETVYFVRDNGVGFDMAYVGRLFGAFQRLHRQSEYAGTGVGLATVQRILTRHGGKVWAEAAVDQGATFYFTVGRPAGAKAQEEAHS